MHSYDNTTTKEYEKNCTSMLKQEILGLILGFKYINPIFVQSSFYQHFLSASIHPTES